MITEIQDIGHEVVGHMTHADARLGLMDELSLALAFGLIGGLVAMRLKLPPIVGFLVAGIAMSPYTPGHIADVHTAEQLGEIGVAFLMFGVGMHFSIKDLLEVKGIAIPGAIIQSLLATGLTIILTIVFGWSLGAGIALALKQSRTISLMIGAGLAQIGEFSFILGTLGPPLGLLPDEAYQLIIAGAIISIALNRWCSG